MKLRIKKEYLTNGYIKDVVYKRQVKIFRLWFTYRTT